eukprot:scaffold358_cov343-Pavlova_lutheri.AAC.1
MGREPVPCVPGCLEEKRARIYASTVEPRSRGVVGWRCDARPTKETDRLRWSLGRPFVHPT